MGRAPTRANDPRSSPDRLDELDAEAIRSVCAFLVARAERRAPDARATAAWERFYAACDPLIRVLAREGSSSGVSDLDDRVQEVWRALVIHLGQYDPRRGPLRNWLMVVIRNELARQRRTRHELRHLDEESEQRLASRESDPMRACELGQERHRILAGLQELRSRISEADFRIVYVHWIEGKGFAEIAATLGLTPKQVRDRHRRMVRKLRDRLSIRD